MINKAKSCFKSIFSISLNLVDPKTLGFLYDNEHTSKRLKNIGLSFLAGYHAVLKESDLPVKEQIDVIDRNLQGFAFEGAGMAFALLDSLFPTKKRLETFLNNDGKNHKYMILIGMGWCLGKLPYVNCKKYIDKQDPLLKWLILDGYGFHEGYFSPQKSIVEQKVPTKLNNNYEVNAFTQGLGRSLWFYTSGNINSITSIINSFPLERRADLWSGIGLASTYAGGVEDIRYYQLRDQAGIYLPEIAQGAAFACKARIQAGLINSDTENAVKLLLNMDANTLSNLTDLALKDLTINDDAFETWRKRIQSNFRRGGLYAIS